MATHSSSAVPADTLTGCRMATMSSTDLNDLVKPIMLKDLRTQCRARGLTPAGSREALADRIKENMLQTGD